MPDLKPGLLIVDDEPTTRNLLSQIFTRLGYPVRAAEDGFAALEAIRKESPAILVSDLNMPRMSGFELLSVVRRKSPRIYVIATSGAFSGDVVPNGIAADAFHPKATGLTGLLDAVTFAAHANYVRAGSAQSTPLWFSPVREGQESEAQVLVSCPECLRAFPFVVGASDFLVRETACIYCNTPIFYATVQPMNPELPHSFHPAPAVPLSHLSRGIAS